MNCFVKTDKCLKTAEVNKPFLKIVIYLFLFIKFILLPVPLNNIINITTCIEKPSKIDDDFSFFIYKF